MLDDTHKDCRVRRKRVLDAIVWLKANNPYYKDIVIDYKSLQQLPEDDIPSGLQVVEDNDTAQENEDNADCDEHTAVQEDGDGDVELPRSFLPLPVHKKQEQDGKICEIT